jgi:Flp pilus assembly protein TadG
MAPMFALALPMLAASVGFTIDGARMFSAKTQLQVAADAAAAAAIRKISSGASTEAVRVAGLNLPAAQNGTVLASKDVVTGTWNVTSRSFTAWASNPNAVMVTTRFAAANGNAFKPAFASVLGIKSLDISATATALCPNNPSLSSISNTIPSRTAVVTMGQACLPQSGLTGTCYWSTSSGAPIIRVDNWNSGQTTVGVRIVSPSNWAKVFYFTAPDAGQYWVVVPGITMTNAGQSGATTNIVFRMESSSPAVPASRLNTGGTATYNNRFNATSTLPGSPLCASSNQSGASRLVS